MSHRKKKHSSFVQICSQFSNTICRFQEDFCWYSHRTEEENAASEDEEKEPETPSVFQKVVNNPKPPSESQAKNQK